MKPSFSFHHSLLVVLLIALMSSFTIEFAHDLTFNIKIQGLEDRNVVKDGVMPTQLAQMIIEASDEHVKIEVFEIVLARGNRAVSIPNKTVKRNKLDLADYAAFAKAGDKLVIKVNEVTGSNDRKLSDKNILLTIPIK